MKGIPIFDKLGRGAVWRGEISPCLHQNHVFAVRPHHVNPDWLAAIITTSYAKWFFVLRSKQTTNLASISSTNLSELPVVIPPPEEQDEIIAFLDRETARIDGLIAKKRRLIELLRAKRQAVISHAVTKASTPTPP